MLGMSFASCGSDDNDEPKKEEPAEAKYVSYVFFTTQDILDAAHIIIDINSGKEEVKFDMDKDKLGTISDLPQSWRSDVESAIGAALDAEGSQTKVADVLAKVRVAKLQIKAEKTNDVNVKKSYSLKADYAPKAQKIDVVMGNALSDPAPLSAGTFYFTTPEARAYVGLSTKKEDMELFLKTTLSI